MASCVDPSCEIVTSILKATKAVLFALDAEDSVLACLPEERPFLGKPPRELLGKPFGRTFTADFVRVFNEEDGWDEIAYLVGSDGKRVPFALDRIGRSDHPFNALFPQAASFAVLSPLSAYASLESAHERSVAQHATELEAINVKLKRRSRKLKKAMDVLAARNSQIVQEMNLAVELQKSLLPKSYPETELVRFTHRYIPLAMVGGDFFDIVDLGQERIGVLMSDVSGHGIAPAFITAMIRSSFDHLRNRHDSPAAVVGKINEEFSKIIDTDHFVTAFYAIFDFKDMTCTYCNAGHPPQLLLHSDGTTSELASNNPVIGMLDDYDYADLRVPFRYGDTWCFFTDGVIEAHDAHEVLFGVDGIVKSIRDAANEPLEGMADAVITDLIQYMKDPYFEDDITIVIAEVIDSL